MAFNFPQISVNNNDEAMDKWMPVKEREDIWHSLFGSKEAFNESIMSLKPMITNNWSLVQYMTYVEKFVIVKHKFREWNNPDRIYKFYEQDLRNNKLVTGNNIGYIPITDNHMGLIDYKGICEDIDNFSKEIEQDLNDAGVSQLQSCIGGFICSYNVLKKLRRQFYTSLYSLGNEESKIIYQQSPLRYLLMYLIDRRLSRLIPSSKTFKFSPEYFNSLAYQLEAQQLAAEYMIDKYEADMNVCKIIG